MPKRNKLNFRMKLFRWFIVPIALLALWVAATSWYIINFDSSFLVFSNNHDKSIFRDYSDKPILKGNKITGVFQAEDNNMGIVSIRFKSLKRVAYKDEDALVFRLKEQGANNWYYENVYRSGFIYELPFLPIGFPVIKDSKGKSYYFELESLKGNSHNAMQLYDRSPVFASKYQFSKEELLSDKSLFMHFIERKILNSFSTIDVVFSSFVYLMPFIIYILSYVPVVSRFINPIAQRLFGDTKAKRLVLHYINNYGVVFIISVVLVDVFFLQIINDLLYIFLGGMWYSVAKVGRINTKPTFIFASLLLLLSPLYLTFNMPNIAERAASWAFIFYFIALLQAIRLREYKKT